MGCSSLMYALLTSTFLSWTSDASGTLDAD